MRTENSGLKKSVRRRVRVELVMRHPGLPPGKAAVIQGCRAEYGPELGITLRKKEPK